METKLDIQNSYIKFVDEPAQNTTIIYFSIGGISCIYPINFPNSLKDRVRGITVCIERIKEYGTRN